VVLPEHINSASSLQAIRISIVKKTILLSFFRAHGMIRISLSQARVQERSRVPVLLRVLIEMKEKENEKIKFLEKAEKPNHSKPNHSMRQSGCGSKGLRNIP